MMTFFPPIQTTIWSTLAGGTALEGNTPFSCHHKPHLNNCHQRFSQSIFIDIMPLSSPQSNKYPGINHSLIDNFTVSDHFLNLKWSSWFRLAQAWNWCLHIPVRISNKNCDENLEVKYKVEKYIWRHARDLFARNKITTLSLNGYLCMWLNKLILRHSSCAECCFVFA